MINSIAKKAGREGERARAATRMAAWVAEAKGAEPVTFLLGSMTKFSRTPKWTLFHHEY